MNKPAAPILPARGTTSPGQYSYALLVGGFLKGRMG